MDIHEQESEVREDIDAARSGAVILFVTVVVGIIIAVAAIAVASFLFL